MKRTVVITFEVDPTEYHEEEDSESGTIDLVLDMLRDYADLPEEGITIQCGNTTRKTDDHLED